MCCSKACLIASTATASPRDIEANVAGVREVHHMHVWSMDGTKNMATLHACLTEGTDAYTAVTAIKSRLCRQARHRARHRRTGIRRLHGRVAETSALIDRQRVHQRKHHGRQAEGEDRRRHGGGTGHRPGDRRGFRRRRRDRLRIRRLARQARRPGARQEGEARRARRPRRSRPMPRRSGRSTSSSTSPATCITARCSPPARRTGTSPSTST